MDNSSFDEHSDFWDISELIPVNTNGATSDVYKVRLSGKWHFLKRPKKEYSNHPLYNAAFEKEFDIGYTLEHLNIVRYVSKAKDDRGIYFLTEYIDGQTLADFIEENPDYLNKKEHLSKFIKQLLSALSYLHDKQILHLDLKPDNILITNIGKDVKIIDLGFAYNDCYQFLASGKTTQYAAPEQINKGVIDQRADIYGIGMVLLYIFTHTSDKINLKNIPYKYRNIIGKCLYNNIDKRYQNINALKKELFQKEKNKLVFISFLSFIIVIAVYYLFPMKTKDNPINEINILSSDTIKQTTVIYDTITFPKQKNQKESSPTEIFKKNIEKTIRGYFVELYSKYKSVNDFNIDNIQDAQKLYQDAVNDSFKFMNSLCEDNPTMLCSDITSWVKTELDKNTAPYLSWLYQYGEQGKAKTDSLLNK